MVIEMHTALIGSELTGDGLVKRVCKIEKKTNKHELIIRIGIGAGVLIAFLIGVFIDIKKLIN